MSRSGSCVGFSVKGHSGYSDTGSDIVCASVSSAVMLAVNTAADYFSVDLGLDVSDGNICCKVKEASETSDKLMASLRAHLEEVSKEFPDYLKVNISEV